MSSLPAPPPSFAHFVDLASDATGAFALYATDDYFAEKENLLRPSAPAFDPNAYTDKGKLMDGWESQRKREASPGAPRDSAGHDFCIVRLGMPGSIHGILADTTHFKGNAPQEVSLDGIEAPDTATAADLLHHPGWTEILPRTKVSPDFQNALPLATPSRRVTHVRLHIYPDGGVSRLRVYGVVRPHPSVFWSAGSVDLAAVENGGTVAGVSDQFFGPPSNLLLPGRGVNMGDGWETKRRRTPGSDFCVLRLGRRGVVDRIELDTHFFKGNAPQATLVEALDETTLAHDGGRALEPMLLGEGGWPVLIGRTPLVQHRRHVLLPDMPATVTHLRVHIFPHGGVNRLRVYGHAVDTLVEARSLEALAAMPEADARALLLSFAGARAFADRLLARRPFASARALFEAASEVWWSLGKDDWLEAFAAHPRLGQPKAAETQTARSAAWSQGEQAGLAAQAKADADKLAALNDRYFEKLGFIFILCATGRTPASVTAALEARLENDRDTEIDAAAREQAKITRIRIGKWLQGE